MTPNTTMIQFIKHMFMINGIKRLFEVNKYTYYIMFSLEKKTFDEVSRFDQC